MLDCVLVLKKILCSGFLLYVNVSSMQSGSNSADQGELVSRIKSLELENQSLYTGLCAHFHP